jgi:hypothetical protein
VAVYAIWFSMVASDERERWPARVLADPRVTHWWDEGRQVGRWLGRHPDYGGDAELVIWDTYFLYPRDARWGESPGPVASWGYPIVEHREKLRRDLLALARRAPAPARRPTASPSPRP